jgi:hypothetical protein
MAAEKQPEKNVANEIAAGTVQERLKQMEGTKLPICMPRGGAVYAPPVPISISHANGGFSLTSGTSGPIPHTSPPSSPTQRPKKVCYLICELQRLDDL